MQWYKKEVIGASSEIQTRLGRWITLRALDLKNHS
jgi:hypothetical protein